MGIFKKKCEYCKRKIDKGRGIKRLVKIPALLGERERSFCSEEHANSYEIEVKKGSKSCGKGCCG